MFATVKCNPPGNAPGSCASSRRRRSAGVRRRLGKSSPPGGADSGGMDSGEAEVAPLAGPAADGVSFRPIAASSERTAGSGSGSGSGLGVGSGSVRVRRRREASARRAAVRVASVALRFRFTAAFAVSARLRAASAPLRAAAASRVAARAARISATPSLVSRSRRARASPPTFFPNPKPSSAPSRVVATYSTRRSRGCVRSTGTNASSSDASERGARDHTSAVSLGRAGRPGARGFRGGTADTVDSVRALREEDQNEGWSSSGALHPISSSASERHPRFGSSASASNARASARAVVGSRPGRDRGAARRRRTSAAARARAVSRPVDRARWARPAMRASITSRVWASNFARTSRIEGAASARRMTRGGGPDGGGGASEGGSEYISANVAGVGGAPPRARARVSPSRRTRVSPPGPSRCASLRVGRDRARRRYGTEGMDFTGRREKGGRGSRGGAGSGSVAHAPRSVFIVARDPLPAKRRHVASRGTHAELSQRRAK